MKYLFNNFNGHMQTLREQSCVVEFLSDLLVTAMGCLSTLLVTAFLPRLSKS